jgi:hypothetical protein
MAPKAEPVARVAELNAGEEEAEAELEVPELEPGPELELEPEELPEPEEEPEPEGLAALVAATRGVEAAAVERKPVARVPLTLFAATMPAPVVMDPEEEPVAEPEDWEEPAAEPEDWEEPAAEPEDLEEPVAEPEDLEEPVAEEEAAELELELVVLQLRL